MSILVILEGNSILKSGSLEVVCAARMIAEQSGLDLEAIYVGPPAKDLTQQLTGMGIQKLFSFEDEVFNHYTADRFMPVVASLIRERESKIIFVADTYMGKELSASLAGNLDVNLIQDCSRVHWDGTIKVQKSIYGGRILAHLTPGSFPAIFTLQPKMFAITRDGEGLAEIEKRKRIDQEARVIVRNVANVVGETMDLKEARIIVSGGRGLGGPEHFYVLKDLCKVLGAALGASRAAVDAGWISQTHQVGQTGKAVSPDIYIACGISGAIQHIAGIRDAKIIIAVNNDRNAEIFEYCDYGIVGDIFEIIPALTDELNKQVPLQQ